MELNCDYVLVTVDNELEMFAGVIKDENGNDVTLHLNPNWHPTLHARICATVIAVPKYLSQGRIAYEKYQGFPRGLPYRGHDYIQRAFLETPPKYRKTVRIPYICGEYAPEMVTVFGVPIEVQAGDKVYFHYNTLLDLANFMYHQNGMLVYKVHYASLFCFVRNMEITMLNGYVLVEEVYDEEVNDVEVAGHIIKAKTKGGLVTSVNEKPKFLTGAVRHIGAGIGDDVRTCVPGTLVLFRPSSEFVNNIEGTAYYVMRQWDIIGEWIDAPTVAMVEQFALASGITVGYDTVRPLGDYVMVRPEPAFRQSLHVFDPKAPVQQFKAGELFVPEGSFAQANKRKSQAWGKGRVLACGPGCPGQSTGVVHYGKSAYYVYIEENDVAFIRFGDIYGHEEERQ